MITDQPIDLNAFFEATPDPACGAVASFVGVVRNHDHGRPVHRLRYECYRTMAEKVLASLVDRAKSGWPVTEVRVTHRIGELAIGDAAVAIAVSAAHRDEAFAACRFLIERIKHEVPIWKKQIYGDGSAEWVVCQHPGHDPAANGHQSLIHQTELRKHV